MTNPTDLPRLYGEKEIGQILERAAELQHDEPPAPSAGSMTLQELEAIAAEAGIDPAYLRRAALEVDIGTAERSTKYAKLQLTVASRDGQTSVRLEENLTKSAGEIFGSLRG